MKIAIIGSGLAAVSVAKVLISRGIKPIILDKGETLDSERTSIVNKLSKLDPNEWELEDKKIITSNPTIKDKNKFPLKMAFGSDYFYGKSLKNATIETDDKLPPFSYAKGGFSVGWGSTVLAPDDCDLQAWPIKRDQLEPYLKKTLKDLPYSALNDGLSKYFPIYSKNINPLELTKGNNQLLKDMMESNIKNKEEVSFGQSRLLVRSMDDKDALGCKKCGYCMSGCVYDCIYKSTQDIDTMVSHGSIDYIQGVIVYSLEEINKKVKISFIDKDNSYETLIVDRVFVGAGAVGSTRIVLQSKKLYKHEVRLQSTVAFVAPMLRMKRLPVDWPNANTLPGIFLEYKVNELSNHWVHTQLSTPNELVFQKLGIDFLKPGIIQAIKKNIVGHLVVALCNLHSDHANGYVLSLEKNNATIIDKLISRREEMNAPKMAIKQAVKKLSSLGRMFGCYVLDPFVQDTISSGGYHVGGTLPMKIILEKDTDTNLLGIPKGWSRIHVIDSSTFPSLPGTTIGLLAMANAARIASEIEYD